MKFDFVIGNPPYQEEMQGENETFAPPVYHMFMDAAFEVAEKTELIHPARFLFNAGQTPKTWNEKMLSDPHYKVLDYYDDSKKIFSGVDIIGGVAITYRDKGKSFGAIEVFTSFPELNSLMSKVRSQQSIIEIMELQTRYKLDVLLKEHPECREEISGHGVDKRLRTNAFERVSLFHEIHQTGDAVIFGLVDNKRVYRYIEKKYIDSSHDSFGKYKTVVPKAYGTGIISDQPAFVCGQPEVIEKNIGYTQSFIAIGASDSHKHSTNVLKYIKTKFARACLGILKVTQDNPPEKWRYVPLQDFTEKSDIDWTKSIHEIDLQLYKKYGLTEDEIIFIETHVKEMK